MGRFYLLVPFTYSHKSLHEKQRILARQSHVCSFACHLYHFAKYCNVWQLQRSCGGRMLNLELRSSTRDSINALFELKHLVGNQIHQNLVQWMTHFLQRLQCGRRRHNLVHFEQHTYTTRERGQLKRSWLVVCVPRAYLFITGHFTHENHWIHSSSNAKEYNHSGVHYGCKTVCFRFKLELVAKRVARRQRLIYAGDL